MLKAKICTVPPPVPSGSGFPGSVTVLSSGYVYNDICPGMDDNRLPRLETLPGSADCGDITIELIPLAPANPGATHTNFGYSLTIKNPNLEKDSITALLTFTQPVDGTIVSITAETVSPKFSITTVFVTSSRFTRASKPRNPPCFPSVERSKDRRNTTKIGL